MCGVLALFLTLPFSIPARRYLPNLGMAASVSIAVYISFKIPSPDAFYRWKGIKDSQAISASLYSIDFVTVLRLCAVGDD
jgi:hypothetical protein